MRFFLNILRVLSRHTWWWTVTLVVVLAVALSATRLLLPQLDNYKRELEVQISQLIGQPLLVESFEIGWHGYGPRLFLHNVRVLGQAGEQTLLGFDAAHIDVSLPLSLYRGQVALHSLTLSGIELDLLRQKDGGMLLAGMSVFQAGAQPVALADSAILAWLMRQETLAIENSTLHWRDLQRGDDVLSLTGVNLFLRNTGDDHFLIGQVTLPAAIGGQVRVMADAMGMIDDIENWAVNFYAEGSVLDLAQWEIDSSGLGVNVINGRAKLELWGSVQSMQLDVLKGRLLLRDIGLARAQENVETAHKLETISSLLGEFVWQRQDVGWSLDVDKFRLVVDDVAWQPTRMHIEQAVKGKLHQLNIATNFARLDDVTALLLLTSELSKEQRESLEEIQPRGELSNAYLSLQFENNQLQDYFFRGEINDLAMSPWQKMPGFDGLNASLNMGGAGGVAAISSQGMQFDVRRLFRDVLPVDEMSGHLAWRRQDDGTMFELRQLALTNEDAALQLDGEMFVPTTQSSPVVKLLIDIKRGNGAATSKYLPANILPQKSIAWLDHAIVAGDISSGAMVLQGPLKRFPFEDGSGRFEVQFNVTDGVVDYKQEWPRVEEIEAKVAFVGAGVEINAASGKILASDVKFVDVVVPNLRARPAQLRLFGRAEGATSDVLDFLNQSPLQQRFGAFIDGAIARGESFLDLELAIPLRADTVVDVQGSVKMVDSSFDLQRFGVDLNNVNGVVQFSNSGLTAEAVAATVMGQPARIDIRTEKISQDMVNTVLSAKGETHFAELEKRLNLFFLPYFQGVSQWQARLEIPRSNSGEFVSPTLNVSSDLSGTAVLFPPPIQKSADEIRGFKMSARFNKDSTYWRFNYGADDLSGVFGIGHDVGLKVGELYFSGVAALPTQLGVRIAGEIDHFVYDQWRPLFEVDETSKTKPGLVNQLDLRLGSVELFGQVGHNVDIKAEHIDSRWIAQVHSDKLSGEVQMPDSRSRVLEMDLEYLYLTRVGDKKDREDGVDPAELPPLTIKSKQTRYGEFELGQLDLVTRKLPLGLSIEKFMLTSPGVFEADIKGMWNKRQQHASSINADIRVHDLGSLLGGLGYVEAVQHGEGVGHLELNWAGPLLSYDLASMNGIVDFDFNDGSLLAVEPGAGRLFGLLSISALPRRLLLDFRDFFGKGFAFDFMRGHFDVHDGDAFTNDFTMDGPAARMELQGRVGLLQEDYDQLVKVVPHVTGGLLTLAGLLTGNIASAVIVALIEKLTKSEVDKATGVYYQISGGWDAPLVEPVDLVRAGKSASQSVTTAPLPE